MNFKSLLVVGFGIATLGLSLPARADQATVITNDQNVVVTGNKNKTTQSIYNRVRTNDRHNTDSSGTSIDTHQGADIQGNRNTTTQTTNNNVRHNRRGNGI